MNEGFVADLKMLQPEGGSEPDQLLHRQNDLVLDLYRLVPRLAALSHSELRATWVARSETWWLRLKLVPRRQGLLFDPLSRSRSRPASLREEAQLVRRDLAESPLRALQAAAGFKRWADSESPEPLHEDHEMAYRRSRSQWIMESEAGQLCLVFPEAPRFRVDSEPCRVSGITASVSLRAIELTRVVFTELEGHSLRNLVRNGRLRVVPCATTDEAMHPTPPWALAQQVRPGESLMIVVTLHRCVLSNRVVGAVAAA